MLIEQIIKFELRGPGLLVVHLLPQIVILWQNKNLYENRRVDYFNSKTLQEAMHLVFPHLGQFTYKI